MAKPLASVLIEQGITARVRALERLEEALEAGIAAGHEAVVISAPPPEAIPPARAVAKRICPR